jgi:hypothetical protein
MLFPVFSFLLHIDEKTREKVLFSIKNYASAFINLDTGKSRRKPIRNNAGMVPRENLEESVVRTGRDFPAGGNPCLS